MVRSDLATSGVMFTLDTETGFRDVVLINASYGLGEPIVQGSVTPDEYCVFKPTLKQGFRPILQKTIGTRGQSSRGKLFRPRTVPSHSCARMRLPSFGIDNA